MSLEYYTTDCRHVLSFVRHAQYQKNAEPLKKVIVAKKFSGTSRAAFFQNIQVIRSSHTASFTSQQFGSTLMIR